MGELFQPTHVVIILVVLGVFLLPVIFFILTLQGALRKCSPQSRTIDPGLCWLLIIPIANLVVGFIIVLNMAKSLRNEFNLRGMMVADAEPGQGIGIAMCVCACSSIIPILGGLAALAYLVLWIMYWVKIAGYSRMLDVQPQWNPPVSPSQF